jgi:hypothetical protein
MTGCVAEATTVDLWDRAILTRGHLERQFAAIWHGLPTREGTELHGLDPAAHRQRCRDLVAAGYRPVALTAAVLAHGQPAVTASAWQRPVVSEAEHAALAKRQAQRITEHSRPARRPLAASERSYLPV